MEGGLISLPKASRARGKIPSFHRSAGNRKRSAPIIILESKLHGIERGPPLILTIITGVLLELTLQTYEGARTTIHFFRILPQEGTMYSVTGWRILFSMSADDSVNIQLFRNDYSLQNTMLVWRTKNRNLIHQISRAPKNWKLIGLEEEYTVRGWILAPRKNHLSPFINPLTLRNQRMEDRSANWMELGVMRTALRAYHTDFGFLTSFPLS